MTRLLQGLNRKLIILCVMVLGGLAACEKPEIPDTEEKKNLTVSVYQIEHQDLDWKPFNNLLNLLRQFDGLRIYRLNNAADGRPCGGENGK